MNETKRCPHCGKELPTSAAFCPFCENDLLEKTQTKAPRARKWRLILPPLLAALALILVLHLVINRPRTYLGDAKLTYQSGGKTWQIMAAFGSSAAMTGNGEPTFSTSLPAYENAALPSQIFILEGTSLPEDKAALTDGAAAFIPLVDTYSVEALPEEGSAPMECLDAGPNPDFPYAAYMASVIYSPATGTNMLRWTLHMRNGDTLILQQKITCSLQKERRVSFKDEPMENMEQLHAVLARLAKEEDADTLIEIELAPVIYEGTLPIADRSFVFVGSAQNGQHTVFTGTLEISTREPQICTLYDLDFSGAGGTGIHATQSVDLEHCSFSGYDTALHADNGSWVSFSGCSFTRNKTGFLFDSRSSTSASPEYHDNLFRDNEIGIQIKQIPGTISLQFFDTVFDENGEDCSSALPDRITFS